MLTSHKFRLYPSREQEEKLLWSLDKCRQTYNTLLGELNKQEVIDKAQIQGIIPDLKICEPTLKGVYSKTLQYECHKLFSNLGKLSKLKKNGKKVGRLRFKGKGHFKTFTYNQSGFKLIDTGRRCQTLCLSKIGDIKIRCHRNIKGKIKQITIKKEASGKWFASIIEETGKTAKKQPINRSVGIDLGLNDLAYDSDGNSIPNPRHLKKKAEKLAKLQKKTSKKNKGSNNRNKKRIKLAKQYEKLTNSRDDFLHKLSRYYVNRYDAIGFEDMPINKMVRNSYLAKSILDASWGNFRQLVAYKAARAGKHYITVDYKGTTQRCNQCGKTVNKRLSERVHKCPYCGLEIPRDYNSALEIEKLMLKKIFFGIGQGLPELKLAETPLTAELQPKVYELCANEARTFHQNY